MSQYNGNQYNPDLDAVLYRTQECVKSGRQMQNEFFVQLRSYNGTPAKIEFLRLTPSVNNPNGRKNFRISFEEWQLVKKYAQEIDKLMTQYYQGGNTNPQQQYNNQQQGPF